MHSVAVVGAGIGAQHCDGFAALPERFRVHTTCVRVPVERCHSIAVTLVYPKEVSKADAAALLRAAPGITFITDDLHPPLPGPLARTHSVHVGRLRRTGDRVLQLWIVGDQILKGAALNAVQIAELWASR